MKLYNLTYTLFFFLSIQLSEILESLTPIMLKFMVLAVIVPIVSVYMLFDDPLQDNPSWKQIFIAFLTSILFVWIGYEASVETGIPVWIGLILSFAVGLSAMPIIRKVRTKLPKAVESIIDYIPEWVKNKIK